MIRSAFTIVLAVITLCSCSGVTRRDDPSSAPVPDSFKEAEGWARAEPSDALDRGPWWQLFRDPTLDKLVSRVEVSNQNVAAAVAAYDQARALVREQRAGLLPSVNLDGGASRSRSGGNTRSNYQVTLGTTWEPDVWGRLRHTIEAASAVAEASAADIASARLSAQGELASDYFSIRGIDAQRALLRTTITGFERSLQITQNRYDQGVAARTDVLQAQTQLSNARADLIALQSQRAQLEHAIAVLIGEPPANFTLEPMEWHPFVPDVPLFLPSRLLERRPDIAAAERRMAAANEQIGVARAAFYPALNLTGNLGDAASRIGDLFSASGLLWSLGISAAQTLFDAGARSARVEQNRAAYEAAIARYRQTVLTAFQHVEDELAAARVLEEQEGYRREASQAADDVEQQVLNRYRAGLVGFTEVVTAQATALSARRALVQMLANRQTTAVALIQALGGGWTTAALP